LLKVTASLVADWNAYLSDFTLGKSRFVLDSFAVIAFLQDEEGADKIEEILLEKPREEKLNSICTYLA
jgi:hypothetical protein